jgi:hypothetical protein
MNLKYKFLSQLNEIFYEKYRIKNNKYKNIVDHFLFFGFDNGYLSSREQFYNKFKKLKSKIINDKNEIIKLTQYYNYDYLYDNFYKNLDIKIFNWNSYVNNYNDLIKANINTKEKALWHWNNYGKKENRNFRENINNLKLTCYMVLINPEENCLPYEYSIFSLLNICDEIVIIKDSNEKFSTNRIKKINKNIRIIESNESVENYYMILNSELKKSKSDFCLLIEGNNIFPHFNFKSIRNCILNSSNIHTVNLKEYIINRNNIIYESGNNIKVINNKLLKKDAIRFKVFHKKNCLNINYTKNIKEKFIDEYAYKYLFYFCSKDELYKKWYKYNQYITNKKIFSEEYKETNIKLILEDFNLKINDKINIINDKNKIINLIKNIININIFNLLLKITNEYRFDVLDLNIIYNNLKFYKMINYDIENLSIHDLRIIIKNKFVIHNGNLLNSSFVKEKPIYQTFWMGKPFTNLEYISLNSFIKNDCIVHLYTYQKKIGNVPEGVIIKDASNILPESELFTYSNDSLGKSSISAFTNLFRFKLLFDKGNYWIDTDIVNIKKFNDEMPFIFTSEPHEFNYKIEYCKKERISSFIIKIPQHSYIALYGYMLCLESKKDVLKGNLKWGMGPKAMKTTVSKFGLDKYVQPWYFTSNCACHHFLSLFDDNYKIDLDNYKNLKLRKDNIYINFFTKLKDKYDDTYYIHLWNQFWNRNNIDKNGEFKKDSIMYELKNKYL